MKEEAEVNRKLPPKLMSGCVSGSSSVGGSIGGNGVSTTIGTFNNNGSNINQNKQQNDEILSSLLRMHNFDSISSIKDESLDIDLSACVTITADPSGIIGSNSLSSSDFWRIMDDNTQTIQLQLDNSSNCSGGSSSCCNRDITPLSPSTITTLHNNGVTGMGITTGIDDIGNNSGSNSTQNNNNCRSTNGLKKLQTDFTGTFLRPEVPTATVNNGLTFSPLKRNNGKSLASSSSPNDKIIKFDIKQFRDKSPIMVGGSVAATTVATGTTIKLEGLPWLAPFRIHQPGLTTGAGVIATTTAPPKISLINKLMTTGGIGSAATTFSLSSTTTSTIKESSNKSTENSIAMNIKKEDNDIGSSPTSSVSIPPPPLIVLENCGKQDFSAQSLTTSSSLSVTSKIIDTVDNGERDTKTTAVAIKPKAELFYKCFDCNGKLFQNNQELHKLHQGHRIQYKCSECDKEYDLETSLKKHLRTHRNSTNGTSDGRKDAWKKCPDCGKCLKLGSMWMHRKIHADNKKYGCDICGQKFVQKINLTQHIRIHTAEKPYECAECHKRFQERSHLQRHQKYHAQTRSYRCDKCGKMYKTERCLKVHNLVHLDKRPFACDRCDKSFISNSKLKQHSNIHTGERPFKCNYCTRDFTNFPNWLKHTRRRHKVDHKTGEILKNMPSYCSKKSNRTASSASKEKKVFPNSSSNSAGVNANITTTVVVGANSLTATTAANSMTTTVTTPSTTVVLNLPTEAATVTVAATKPATTNSNMLPTKIILMSSEAATAIVLNASNTNTLNNNHNSRVISGKMLQKNRKSNNNNNKSINNINNNNKTNIDLIENKSNGLVSGRVDGSGGLKLLQCLNNNTNNMMIATVKTTIGNTSKLVNNPMTTASTTAVTTTTAAASTLMQNNSNQGPPPLAKMPIKQRKKKLLAVQQQQQQHSQQSLPQSQNIVMIENLSLKKEDPTRRSQVQQQQSVPTSTSSKSKLRDGPPPLALVFNTQTITAARNMDLFKNNNKSNNNKTPKNVQQQSLKVKRERKQSMPKQLQKKPQVQVQSQLQQQQHHRQHQHMIVSSSKEPPPPLLTPLFIKQEYIELPSSTLMSPRKKYDEYIEQSNHHKEEKEKDDFFELHCLSITSAEELLMEEALEWEECMKKNRLDGGNGGDAEDDEEMIAASFVDTDNALSSDIMADLHFKIKQEHAAEMELKLNAEDAGGLLKKAVYCSSLESSPFSSPASMIEFNNGNTMPSTATTTIASKTYNNTIASNGRNFVTATNNFYLPINTVTTQSVGSHGHGGDDVKDRIDINEFAMHLTKSQYQRQQRSNNTHHQHDHNQQQQPTTIITTTATPKQSVINQLYLPITIHSGTEPIDANMILPTTETTSLTNDTSARALNVATAIVTTTVRVLPSVDTLLFSHSKMNNKYKGPIIANVGLRDRVSPKTHSNMATTIAERNLL